MAVKYAKDVLALSVLHYTYRTQALFSKMPQLLFPSNYYNYGIIDDMEIIMPMRK